MDYEFTMGEPISEEQALAEIAALGFHGLAYDDAHDVDEPLHWHDFANVTYVISGSGSFADEHGAVTELGPGCRLQAPAGWLHRTLAGTKARVVTGLSVPGDQLTSPINKDPADRPAELAV